MDFKKIIEQRQKLVQNEHQTWKCNACQDTWVKREDFTDHYHWLYWYWPYFCDCDLWEDNRSLRKKEEKQQKFRENRLKEKYKEFIEEENHKVPSVYRWILRDSLERQWIKKEISKYVDSFEKMFEKWWWYYFWGNVWSWKTYAMMVILNELKRRYWFDATFYNFASVLDKYKKWMWSGMNEAEKYFLYMEKCSILFLDDVWVEKGGERVTERMYNVINSRYEWKKVTIMTSNQSLEDFSEHYNKQTASRIQEMCKIVKFAWTDKRKDLRPDF